MMARRFAVACVIAATLSFPACAQSIVGTWQTTHPAGPDGPAFVWTITYAASGDFYGEMAIAPGPNAAGGLVKTPGTYQTDGAGSVRVTYGSSVMCIATGCSPAPPQIVPAPGSSVSFTVQFRGNDQAVSEDGIVFVRVR